MNDNSEVCDFASRPCLLSIGIDGDMAIVVEDQHFTVLGNGAMSIVDGVGVTRSNVAEARQDDVLSIYDVRLHVLASGDTFGFGAWRPHQAPSLDASAALLVSAYREA